VLGRTAGTTTVILTTKRQGNRSTTTGLRAVAKDGEGMGMEAAMGPASTKSQAGTSVAAGKGRI